MSTVAESATYDVKPAQNEVNLSLQTQVLFARQPIFDRNLSVFGYELLFRDGPVSRAVFVDGDQATLSVMLNVLSNSDIYKTLNGKPGLLNVTRTMLNAVPEGYDDRLILEILEDCHGDQDLPELLAELRKRGYRLALDDFESKDYRPELLRQVQLVKVDVLASTRAEIESLLVQLGKHPVRLIAEKVEDYETYQYCVELGFDYFQGYFFCQPENVEGFRLDPGKQAILKLLTELYRP